MFFMCNDQLFIFKIQNNSSTLPKANMNKSRETSNIKEVSDINYSTAY